MFHIFLFLIFILYFYAGWRYLRLLKKNCCKCAVHEPNYQKLEKWIQIVIGTYILAFIFSIGITTYNKKPFTNSNLILIALLFTVLIEVFRVIYSYYMIKFTTNLHNDKCDCSKGDLQELNYYFSFFHIGYKSFLLLAIFYFLFNYKKMIPLLKRKARRSY